MRTINEHPGWIIDTRELQHGHPGLWTYTDGRGAAQAFRLAADKPQHSWRDYYESDVGTALFTQSED